MMTQDEINAIERDTKVAKEAKALNTSLERLIANRDFRTVILGAYFKDEAVRLVHLKGDPSMQTAERQTSIIKQMDAISALDQFFLTIRHTAGLAEKEIATNEAILEEAREEGGA